MQRFVDSAHSDFFAQAYRRSVEDWTCVSNAVAGLEGMLEAGSAGSSAIVAKRHVRQVTRMKEEDFFRSGSDKRKALGSSPPFIPGKRNSARHGKGVDL